MTDHDPKDTPTNEWETTDNAWIAHYPSSTTSDFPIAAAYVKAESELELLRVCCRSLLEDREDDVAWEWLEELVARK